MTYTADNDRCNYIRQPRLDEQPACFDRQGSVSYDLQNRKSIKMAFSMAGFKTALEALRKSGPN